MIDLKNKVAIVTGAGSGLGEATVMALAEAGSAVVAVDVREDQVQRVCQRAAELTGRAMPLPFDVSDELAVRKGTEVALAELGRIDFLVNNAGVDFTLPLTELTVEQWDRVIGVNLRGPFLLSRAVLPTMQRQRSGHIVNVASTAAKRAWANAAAYHASKWGLVGFTQGLGVEGRPFNIKATAIVPGGMRTHFFDRFEAPPDPADLQDPANVAQLIVFILSQPVETVVQEVIVTPLTETSWP